MIFLSSFTENLKQYMRKGSVSRRLNGFFNMTALRGILIHFIQMVSFILGLTCFIYFKEHHLFLKLFSII